MINRLTKKRLLRKGKIVKSIVICYSIMLFAMCAINIAFYYVVKNKLAEKEIYAGEEYLSSLGMIMDQKLTEVHNLSYSFLTNSDNVIRMKDIENITNQYRIGVELNHLMISSAIADKVFLYNHNKELVCSEEGVFNKSSYMQEAYGWSEQATQNLNEALSENKGYVIFAPTEFYDKEKTDISMIIATSVIDDNQARLIITVNKDRYRNLVLTGSNKGEVYIINDNGGILFSTDTTDRSGIIGTVLGSRMKRGRISEDDNIVLWCNSNCFRGTYIRLVSEKIIYQPIRSISICLILECILLMLIGISAAPALFRISYMPIYNIVSYFRGMLGDSAEEEITDEYNYIISGLGDLESRMKENSAGILLYDYIHNGIYREELEDIFKYDYFSVAVIRLRSKRQVSAFVERIKKNSADMKCLVLDRYKYVVIMNSADEDMNECKEEIRHMINEVENAVNERVLVSISDTLTGVEKINILCRRAGVACDNGILSGIGNIFEYNADSDMSLGKLYFPDDVESVFINALKNGEMETISRYIDEIFEKNSRISMYLFEILKTRLLNIYFKVGMIQCGTVDYDNDFFEYEYEPDEIRKEFVSMFARLAISGMKNTEAMSKTQMQMIDYVNDNYSNDIFNIYMVAEYLNLSVPYTSKLFKQTTGQTFKEYLITKRVDEAKKLLLETNYSVKEVSEMIGAGTYNSFVRMFKNKVGISPGQYREKRTDSE